MSCGADQSCSSDPALLWLWCRPAARALIQPLAWEPPYAMGVTLKRQKKVQNYIAECRRVHLGVGGNE